MYNSPHFLPLVWPEIRPILGGGKIIDLETTQNEFFKSLDRNSGLDYWQHMDNGQHRGIAVRIVDQPWKTFTIRYANKYGDKKVEFQKRLDAMRNLNKGIIFPAVTVQALVSNGILQDVAVVETYGLYKWLSGDFTSDVPIDLPTTPISYGHEGQSFITINWSDVKRAGIKIWSKSSGDLVTFFN
jgi:hypothetical protein